MQLVTFLTAGTGAKHFVVQTAQVDAFPLGVRQIGIEQHAFFGQDFESEVGAVQYCPGFDLFLDIGIVRTKSGPGAERADVDAGHGASGFASTLIAHLITVDLHAR